MSLSVEPIGSYCSAAPVYLPPLPRNSKNKKVERKSVSNGISFAALLNEYLSVQYTPVFTAPPPREEYVARLLNELPFAYNHMLALFN